MPRTYPLPNPEKNFPVPSGVYPVPTPSEAFLFMPGASKRALLGQTVFPYGELMISDAAEVTLIESKPPGGSFATIALGDYSTLLDAARFIQDTPDDFGSRTYELRVTAGGNVLSKEVDIVTDVRITSSLIVVANGRKVRPFSSATFAATDEDLSQVNYSISGASTVAKESVPRAELLRSAHDGAANHSSLIDSSSDFVGAGVRVGDTVRNTTDGSEGTIVTVATSELTADLSGGTDNDYNVDDLCIVYVQDSLLTRPGSFEFSSTVAGEHLLTLFTRGSSTEVSATVRVEVLE